MNGLLSALVVCAVIGLGGCSALAVPDLQGAAAACIKGNGPPMTGSGHVAFVRLFPEFVGKIIINSDCGIAIEAE